MAAVADTIAAIATPPGRGGVGIVRISGPKALQIGQTITGLTAKPRQAYYAHFLDADCQTIDHGLLLYFRAPQSFTGEHVVELQGHGGPVVMDALLQRCVELGARIARAGEFSERAFLNDKLDLAQAEAIADLIDAETQAAARLAVRSLAGVFSDKVHALVDELTALRMYVEAAIDFPEEEIDFLSDGRVANDVQALATHIATLKEQAHVGRVLRDGMRLVIAGLPNAGKSSLLNALAGTDSAIVTDVPGTTRDVLRETIQIDGMPVHLVDTAGLRDTEDKVERIGIERAEQELLQADRILWVYDGVEDPERQNIKIHALSSRIPVTYIHNKADQSGVATGITHADDQTTIVLSARDGQGIDVLREHLRECMGLVGNSQGEFIARRRHLAAIEAAEHHIHTAQQALIDGQAGELMAEDLRQAQIALSEITGEFTADDLLGEIFSSFCIGK